MEISIWVESLLRHIAVIIAIVVGSLVLKHLSTRQKIIYSLLWLVLIFGIWATIRISNGLYSIIVYNIGGLFFFSARVLYVNYELKDWGKKYLFNIPALLLLSSFPIHWFLNDLNKWNELAPLIHLLLSVFLFYSIIKNPVNIADQVLRWAQLIFCLGDFIIVLFDNEITWKLPINISLDLTILHYLIANLELIMITISFCLAYWQSKRSLQ
jgi:hypothetical protein